MRAATEVVVHGAHELGLASAQRVAKRRERVHALPVRRRAAGKGRALGLEQRTQYISRRGVRRHSGRPVKVLIEWYTPTHSPPIVSNQRVGSSPRSSGMRRIHRGR